MSAAFEKLFDVLAEIHRLSRELLDASRQKTEALRTLDLKSIQQASEEEERLSREIGEQDRLRCELVAEITGEKPRRRKGFDPLMDRVGALMAAEDRLRLRARRDELASVMRQIQLTNITNSIVSRRSLQHFRELIGLIAGGGPVRESTYTRRGSMSEFRPQRGFVDHIA